MSSLAFADACQDELFELESDLASVACQAAIELDNLLLGRFQGSDAIQRLLVLLSESMPSSVEPTASGCLVDPTAAVVVNRAISEASSGEPVSRLDELIRETDQFTRRLERVVASPEDLQGAGQESLRRLRTFCLALSKHASAVQRRTTERVPKHPYRR